MIKTIARFLFYISIISTSYANLDNQGKIVPNSLIKASDMNTIFSNINTLHGNSITFDVFNKGDFISKTKIMNQLSKIDSFYSSEPFVSTMSSLSLNNLILEISDLKNFRNQFVLDPSCDCYKNIKYVDSDTISWVVDNGFMISDEVQRTVNIYKPTLNNNGKVMYYAHQAGETSDMSSILASSLLTKFRATGYTVVSIEFRHPIMERELITELTTTQKDIVHAIRKIRKNSKFLGLSLNDANFIGVSKGTFALENVLSTDSILTDSYGRISFKKMYLLDAQITYNQDTYYSLYTDQSDVCLSYYMQTCLTGYITAYAALNMVNNGLESVGGMVLTKNLEVNESYRSLDNTAHLTTLASQNKLPILRFGYNSINNGKQSPALVLSEFYTQVFEGETDYLIHQPMAGDYFCNRYSLLSACNSINGLGHNAISIVNDVDSFFAEPI